MKFFICEITKEEKLEVGIRRKEENAQKYITQNGKIALASI